MIPIAALTPAGGTLPNLSLNFSNTQALDPRINFSRTTNATVTNSAGVITYAPHNLLTYSEQFDNAYWTKLQITVSANTTTAPNGTLTAEKLVEDTNSGLHRLQKSAFGVTGIHTLSVYAKAAERTQLYLSFPNIGNTVATFNLDTGTLGNAQAAVISRNITSVGNGWYRCDITANITSTSGGIDIAAAVNNVISYQGDGVSGIYIWGAQLEIGSTATAYNSTTVKNLLGYSELFDNAAWTKSNSFVQTNMLTYSEAFDNAGWSKSNATVTANNTIAPNGYQTADKIVENTATSTHQVSQGYSSSSGKYVFSAYLKAAERTTAYLQLSDGATGSVFAMANLSAGTVTKTATGSWTNTDVSITPVGDGWFRVSAIGTQGAGATIFPTIALGSSTSGYTGDGTSGIFVWGAQLVQGSAAGDYRRTDAAALPVYYPNHNGVVCAEKLVENTVNSTHGITEAYTAAIGTVVTFSCYMKAIDRNWARLTVNTATGANASAYFNLSTGAIGSIGGGTASIVSAGNGWYRCSITGTLSTANPTLAIFLANADVGQTYTGDGTSGIYIFGAQLSDSASLDPYVLNAAAAPTAAAYYGARFDYDPVTLAPKGLLIEEQRANLLLNSKLDGTDLATQSVTVTAVAHTLSFYGTGTVTLSGTAVAVVAGTGAYPTRTTLTFTPTAGIILFTVTGTVQYAQLEIGAFATSFIPTAASQVTRAVDVATIQGSNFYSWINQNEGTILASGVTNNTNTSTLPTYLSLSQSTTAQYNIALLNASNVNPIIYLQVDAGTNQAGVTGIGNARGSFNKVGGVYKINDFQFSVNNTLGAGDTSGNIPLVEELKIGRLYTGGQPINGTIKSISYYPQRLSDSVLKGLTA